ncbi:MAG TPA: hypothetical protein VGL77_17525 [Armatimonadota bacterium]
MSKKKIIEILAYVIGVSIIAFLGVTGGLLYISEYIPANAQIYVYPSQQSWAPNAFFMKRDFELQSSDPTRAASIKKWLSEQTPAVYADVEAGGKYAGFETFPVLLKGPGYIKRGWQGSLLLSWFLKRPRWNADGSWNW